MTISSSSKRTRRQQHGEHSSKLQDTLQQMVTSFSARTAAPQASADDLFGRSVGLTLARIDHRVSAITKMRIQQLLVETEFDQSQPQSMHWQPPNPHHIQ